LTRGGINVGALVRRSKGKKKRTGLEGCPRDGFSKVLPDLFPLDFGIIDVNVRLLGQEVTDERDGGGFTSIAGIGLESKPENSNPLEMRRVTRTLASGGRAKTGLIGDGVEQGVNNLLRKPPLLVLVHLHNLSPVGSDLRQMQTLTQIHQVQDVFLETRSAETDRGL
jgi:hypothetical protein